MPLYKKQNSKLSLIKEKKIDLEKDIQKLTEENLDTVFGLEVVSTEFSMQNFRLDTLAFDDEAKAFVIIEYKRDRSFSVIDQGFSYLQLMVNNKADFILEYNEKMKGNLKREDVDWSQSRVVFVANSFTTYQRNAINFKDLPIDLWEAKYYGDGLVLFNQIKPTDATESINKLTKTSSIGNVSTEIRSYSVDDHFKDGWTESRSLYEELRERVFEVDTRFDESPKKYYIGYKIDGSVLFEVKIQKAKIIIGLFRVQPEDLNDPEKLTKYQKNSFKYFNKHITEYYIHDQKDIAYGMMLIKQVYEKFNK
jgi:predicted transport protein